MSDTSNHQTGRSNILGFLKNITEKNYAEANKYLRSAVEDKMKVKISQAAKKTGF